MDKDKTKPSELKKDVTAIAPDGGWGWVVVIGAFMLVFLVGGSVHTFGVIYVALLEKFQQSAGTTAWVGSMANALGLMFGPVSSALSNRFSCRSMVVVGGILTSAGWFTSSFVPRLEYMFLTYGLVSGIGKSLAYTTSIIMVGKWFDKRRSLVNGFTVAGAGLGMFAFAPLLETLLRTFSLSGTMRIMGGVMLLICICGALFRPPPPMIPSETEVTPGSENTKSVCSLDSKCEGETDQSNDISNISGGNSNECLRKNSVGQDKLGTGSGVTNDENVENTVVNVKCNGYDFEKAKYDERNLHTIQRIQSFNEDVKHDADNEIIVINQYKEKNKNQKKKESKTVRDLLDYTLLKNPYFLCFNVSVTLATLGHSPASVMLPPMARQHDITSEKTAYLLSIMGIADVVGRLTFGAICDIRFFKNNRKYLFIISLFVSGMSNITCGFVSTYLAFGAYAVIFGLFAGAYNALTPVILVDLLGADKLSSSFGLALLFQGIGYLFGPPLAGWLKDGFGNYQSSFYFAGVSMVLGSLAINIPTLCTKISDWKSRTQKETSCEPAALNNKGFQMEHDCPSACKLVYVSTISATHTSPPAPCSNKLKI